MKTLSCPIDPSHRLTTEAVTKKGSPHTIKVLCAEEDCGAFVKWGTHKDVLAINTEHGVAHGNAEASALLCPLMSGMVLQPAKSGVRPPAWFESVACLENRCGWYDKKDDKCSIVSISRSLDYLADATDRMGDR